MTEANTGLALISPCKLNLCLFVLGKRPDGFHNLQSIFVPLSFGDTMSFVKGHAPEEALEQIAALNARTAFNYAELDGHGVKQAPAQNKVEVQSAHGITLVSTKELGVALEHNLIFKAAKLLQEKSGQSFAVTIGIDKRIPMGGGLGGGSSNAASTLLALNHLFSLNLSQETLQDLGAQLGSDVPFFVQGTSALVEGRGEVITPLELKPCDYLVVIPKCHVSTKEIFTDPELKQHYSALRSHEEIISDPYGNDLLPVVTKKFCEIGHTLDRLVKYGRPAMSGTGASCFVACSHADDALAEVLSGSVLAPNDCGYTIFSAKLCSPSLTIQALS